MTGLIPQQAHNLDQRIWVPR